MLSKDLKYIYIASPYTLGDVEQNVRVSLDAADKIVAFGYIPFAPLLSHYWEKHSPHPYDFWIEYNLKWLERCDAVVRLPGQSKGADGEVKRAKELGLPIFYGLDDFFAENGVCRGVIQRR